MSYIPEKGDLIWLEFEPQTGNEHRGRRPAIVLSPASYNSKTSLAIVCPITSKVKDYPFEVKVIYEKINGAILSDQVKSLDFTARKAKFITKAPAKIQKQVEQKLKLLLFS